MIKKQQINMSAHKYTGSSIGHLMRTWNFVTKEDNLTKKKYQ